MSFGVTFGNDLSKLIFQGTAIANLADNAASSPITNLFVALHTADPSAGNQKLQEDLSMKKTQAIKTPQHTFHMKSVDGVRGMYCVNCGQQMNKVGEMCAGKRG